MRRCNLNRFASIVLTSFVIAVAGSCEHKELCYYHPHTAPVKVNVDWSRFPMEDPTGMTAYSYLVGGKENKVFRMISHNIDYITLDLEAGFFNTIVFNQSESEYGSFEFVNLDDYSSAQVRVLQVKSNWYVSKATDTKVGTEPEWLAVGRAEKIEVTEEMVKIAEKEYLDQHKDIISRSGTRSVHEVATITPTSVVKQVEFNVFAKGLYNLRSARAAMEGMTEGRYLSSGKPFTSEVAHTLDTWSVVAEPNDPASGYITSIVSTFGLPEGHSGDPKENKFSISLLLVDNKTVLTYDYYIGDLLTALNELSDIEEKIVINLEIPERLPDVLPVGGSGGGFSADVDDWGDEITTEIPIM